MTAELATSLRITLHGIVNWTFALVVTGSLILAVLLGLTVLIYGY